MRQNSESWVWPCCIITILIGTIFLVLISWFGILFLTISFLFISIIYLARVSTSNTHRRTTQRLDDQSAYPSKDHEEPPPSEIDSELVRARFLDAETPQLSSHEEPIPEKEGSSEKSIKDTLPSHETLQRRIDKLEKRVRFLRQQLEEEPTPDQTISTEPKEDKVPQDFSLDDEEELSELAIQQLLETIDEKLEKGAISKQLYQRLRDKFLTRLKKLQDSYPKQSQRRAEEPKEDE
jgi:hypothetical protein